MPSRQDAQLVVQDEGGAIADPPGFPSTHDDNAHPGTVSRANGPMPVTLAVVVCSRDRPEQLRRCLQAVVRQDADDILVVDSASSTTATAEVAAAGGVRCIRADLPGLAHARNVALRASTADVVAFTDDDCEP